VLFCNFCAEGDVKLCLGRTLKDLLGEFEVIRIEAFLGVGFSGDFVAIVIHETDLSEGPAEFSLLGS
jgi:hypothetical protein